MVLWIVVVVLLVPVAGTLLGDAYCIVPEGEEDLPVEGNQYLGPESRFQGVSSRACSNQDQIDGVASFVDRCFWFVLFPISTIEAGSYTSREPWTRMAMTGKGMLNLGAIMYQNDL
jgi:hypothetical protein